MGRKKVSAKKNEFKLCIDSATDVARLGALCFCIQRFVAVFSVPPRCTALTSIALYLHWIGHRHYTLNENTTLEINKRATASTNHIYSFLFILLLLLLQLPRPSPLHYQLRPPCHSHDGTVGLLVVCVCVSARLKAYVRSMYLAFHSLKATSKCFVVPAILLFWGNRGANSR